MKSGYLQVENKHQIYFETKGNPNGIPVLVVNGGPGMGMNIRDIGFFNQEKYHIILFDQRGAGKSLPLGALETNDTDRLVHDIRSLLDFLGIKKVILFGGSWGSCLSLVFAIRHPENVAGLVLRGIFLGTHANRKHFEKGGNANQFPKIWKRFKSLVPLENQKEVFSYYLEKILGDDIDVQRIYAYELDRYGLSLSRLEITPTEVTEQLENYNGVSSARIFAHYSSNNFFLSENYIIEHAYQIPDVPIHLGHGQQDYICLPEISKELHKVLPHSKLHLVEGGHSQHCSGVQKQLKTIMSEW